MSDTARRRNFIKENSVDGFCICIYCERKLTIEQATIDHYIPQMYKDLIRGMGQKNWRIACAKCNSRTKNIINSRIANLFAILEEDWDYYKKVRIERKMIEVLNGAFVDVGVLYGKVNT